MDQPPSYTKTYHKKSYPATDPTKPELTHEGKIVVVTGGMRLIQYLLRTLTDNLQLAQESVKPQPSPTQKQVLLTLSC